MRVHALILAGGSGTRLWPVSREDLPKQFLTLLTEPWSMLQQTARRVRAVTAETGGTFHIITQAKWESLILRQMSALDGARGGIFLEPQARNTAPAIALGIARLLQNGAALTDMALVCPSDQLIPDNEAFVRAVGKARLAAQAGYIVTFGIVPVKPETGFGYIKTAAQNGEYCAVESFVEKPSLEKARSYLASGHYLWNAGIFYFCLKDFIAACRLYFPESADLFDAAARGDERAVNAAFSKMPSLSIDYALMERIKNIACVRFEGVWSDIGSWDAVYENAPHDQHNNAVSGNVVLRDSSDCLVHAEDRLVAGIGLSSMLIVETRDALFIAPRGSSQLLSALVKSLSQTHPAVVREPPPATEP